MAFCTTCGRPLREGARFCASCGQAVPIRAESGAPTQETATPAAKTPSAPADSSAPRPPRVTRRALIVAGAVIVVAAAAVGLALSGVLGGADRTGGTGGTGGTPTKAATSLAPPVANTQTKMGLNIWVPSGWSVAFADPSLLSLAPKEFADAWGTNPPGGMIGIQVFGGPTSETPADRYQDDKRTPNSSVSPARKVDWLGLPGLRWTGSTVGMTYTATAVGGGGGSGYLSIVEVLPPAPIAKYQAQVDAILAAMKRVQ